MGSGERTYEQRRLGRGLDYSSEFNSDQQGEVRKVKDRGTLMNGNHSITREVSKSFKKNICSVIHSVNQSFSI